MRNEGVYAFRGRGEKINEQKVIDALGLAPMPLDIRFRGNVLTKLSRGLVRRLVDVRRIDLGAGRESEGAVEGRGERGGKREPHEDYGFPVTARLIIARRVSIYERAVTDVERRRTNSEGDIYNLRGRDGVERNEIGFHSGGSVAKGLWPREFSSEQRANVHKSPGEK